MLRFYRSATALNRLGLGTLLLVLVLLPAGCIGTDFLEDLPPIMEEPRIEISPPSAAILVGETAQFAATYYGTSGEPSTVPVSWASSNAAFAEVNTDGQVSGRAQGQVMITATAEGISTDPAILTVVADPNQVAQVVVAPDTILIDVAMTQTFTAMALNLNGAPIQGLSFTWQSALPDVATIDANGQATALKPGSAPITATTEGVSSLPAILNVLGQTRTGAFRARAGTSYTVEGTAILEERPNNRLRLSFSEDFRSSSGPGLEVFLSTTSGINAQSISLGNLKQNIGAQEYNGINASLDTYTTVVIHCVPFNVTFGSAPLR